MFRIQHIVSLDRFSYDIYSSAVLFSRFIFSQLIFFIPQRSYPYRRAVSGDDIIVEHTIDTVIFPGVFFNPYKRIVCKFFIIDVSDYYIEIGVFRVMIIIGKSRLQNIQIIFPEL